MMMILMKNIIINKTTDKNDKLQLMMTNLNTNSPWIKMGYKMLKISQRKKQRGKRKKCWMVVIRILMVINHIEINLLKMNKL